MHFRDTSAVAATYHGVHGKLENIDDVLNVCVCMYVCMCIYIYIGDIMGYLTKLKSCIGICSVCVHTVGCLICTCCRLAKPCSTPYLSHPRHEGREV